MTHSVGLVIDMTSPDGVEARGKIVEITETHVTIDCNHPLAREELIFDIELLPPGESPRA